MAAMVVHGGTVQHGDCIHHGAFVMFHSATTKAHSSWPAYAVIEARCVEHCSDLSMPNKMSPLLLSRQGEEGITCSSCWPWAWLSSHAAVTCDSILWHSLAPLSSLLKLEESSILLTKVHMMVCSCSRKGDRQASRVMSLTGHFKLLGC